MCLRFQFFTYFADETGETSLHNTLSRREITTKKLVNHSRQYEFLFAD